MTTAPEWSGPIGDVWAAEWQRTDRSFAGLAPHLDAAILAAAPTGPFAALDIGCGAGATSLALAASRPDATIVGIDLSAGQIAVARERLMTVPRRRPGPSPENDSDESSSPDFRVGDVTQLANLPPFDLLYSRHGVMFFSDPVAAFASLRAAAAPGASLVFSCFADRRANRWAAETMAALGADSEASAGEEPGPFAFADPARVSAILTAAGWTPGPPRRVDFIYRAGQGDDPVADALSFFRRIGPTAPQLRAAVLADQPELVDRLTEVLARHVDGDAVDFPAAAWLWSATSPAEDKRP